MLVVFERFRRGVVFVFLGPLSRYDFFANNHDARFPLTFETDPVPCSVDWQALRTRSPTFISPNIFENRARDLWLFDQANIVWGAGAAETFTETWLLCGTLFSLFFFLFLFLLLSFFFLLQLFNHRFVGVDRFRIHTNDAVFHIHEDHLPAMSSLPFIGFSSSFLSSCPRCPSCWPFSIGIQVDGI